MSLRLTEEAGAGKGIWRKSTPWGFGRRAKNEEADKGERRGLKAGKFDRKSVSKVRHDAVAIKKSGAIISS